MSSGERLFSFKILLAFSIACLTSYRLFHSDTVEALARGQKWSWQCLYLSLSQILGVIITAKERNHKIAKRNAVV